MTTATNKNPMNTNAATSNHTHARTARSVRFDLVKGKKADFTKLFNTEVLPTLRKQDGFSDELLMVQDDHVVGVSLWNNAESLKKYEASVYPKIEQLLSPMFSGKAIIETYELATA